MKCENIDGLLTGYILGDLDAAARQTVDAHLAGCGTCRASLQELESTLDLARDALAATQYAPKRLPAKRRQRVMKYNRTNVIYWLTAAHPRLARTAAVVVIAFVTLMFLVPEILKRTMKDSFEQFGGDLPSMWSVFRMGELV